MITNTIHSQRVCVFCGAREGRSPQYRAAAHEFGIWLATHNHTLVYGGGKVGLMGVIARAALENNGRVIGVITSGLLQLEVGYEGITDLQITSSLADRKMKLIEQSDIFVALPGGFGTWDEIFEVVTLRQLGYHNKPLVLLNSEAYFDPFLQTLDRAVEEEFVSLANRQFIASVSTLNELYAWVNRTGYELA